MSEHAEIHISNIPVKLKKRITKLAKEEMGISVSELIKAQLHAIINRIELDEKPTELKRFAARFVKRNISLVIENEKYRSLTDEQKEAVQAYLKHLI